MQEKEANKVNKNKLSRDYECFPLSLSCKKITRYERPKRSDLNYLYIDLNLTRKDVAKFFNIPERIVKTFLKEMGIQKPVSLYIKNTEKTMIEKYGIKTPIQHQDIKRKIENTNILRYGIKYFTQAKEMLDKSKKTCIEKYGVDNPAKVNDFLKKGFIKRKENGNFNSSIFEERAFELLKSKFPNTLRQYSSKEYPFNCDFYIPEKDLYIELQGMWTHGFHPFDENSEQDLKRKKLLEVKSENNKFYKTALKVWTISDPLKRKIAKDRNLNWLEFFTLKDFEKWFSNNRKECIND